MVVIPLQLTLVVLVVEVVVIKVTHQVIRVQHLIKHHSPVQHLMVTRVVMVHGQTDREMVILAEEEEVQVLWVLRILVIMPEPVEPVEHLVFQVHL